MLCDRIIKPDFTKEQIEECGQCKHPSAKIRWCGLFACKIQEAGKIILPADKKVQYPSAVTMAKNFVKATAKQIASGLKTRSEQEQKKCQEICVGCDKYVAKTRIGPRCRLCGCCTGLAKRWKSKHCPATPPKW